MRQASKALAPSSVTVEVAERIGGNVWAMCVCFARAGMAMGGGGGGRLGVGGMTGEGKKEAESGGEMTVPVGEWTSLLSAHRSTSLMISLLISPTRSTDDRFQKQRGMMTVIIDDCKDNCFADLEIARFYELVAGYHGAL